MCIVIVKEMGVKYPSIENVQNACDNNPDGFGIAWAIDGVLRNYRTMSKKDYLRKVREVFKLDYKRCACVLHARIATHGSTRKANTHCWVDEATSLAFAHNGVLSLSNRDDLTDSETFFRDIFLPIYSAHGWVAAERAIDACIGTSKFAFLHANGDVRVFGNYNTLKDVLYSNTSYLARTTYYGGWGTALYYESFWNPVEMRQVYRTTETDAEWAEVKREARSKFFWDYTNSAWRKRTTETDDEWASLLAMSDYDL